MAQEEQQLSFEQIDAHIRKADLSQYEDPGIAALDPGQLLQKVCGVYKVIKPILSGLLLVPFIPATWKAAVRTFMSVLDSICA